MRATVGVLLLCLATDLAVSVAALLLIEHEQRIRRPVRTCQRHRQPCHEHLVDPVPAPAGQPGDRLADAGPQAPGVVADRDPLLRRELGALTLDLDPAGRDADLAVAQHVVGDAVAVGAPVRPRILQRRAEIALA